MSLNNILLTEVPDGPGNEQLCITNIFVYLPPFSFIGNFLATTNNMVPVSLTRHMESIVGESDHSCFTSLSIDFSSESSLSSDCTDSWFTLTSMASKSDLLVGSYIGDG